MRAVATLKFAEVRHSVGTLDGVAFFAPLGEGGGHALFLYRGAHFDCLLRTGEKLDDGREVAFLKFGSAQALSGNMLAIEALLKLRPAIHHPPIGGAIIWKRCCWSLLEKELEKSRSRGCPIRKTAGSGLWDFRRQERQPLANRKLRSLIEATERNPYT